jgi:hypothetical protein
LKKNKNIKPLKDKIENNRKMKKKKNCHKKSSRWREGGGTMITPTQGQD